MKIFKNKIVYTKKQLQMLFNCKIPKKETEVIIHRTEQQTIKIMICFHFYNRKMNKIKNSYNKLLYDCYFYY